MKRDDVCLILPWSWLILNPSISLRISFYAHMEFRLFLKIAFNLIVIRSRSREFLRYSFPFAGPYLARLRHMSGVLGLIPLRTYWLVVRISTRVFFYRFHRRHNFKSRTALEFMFIARVVTIIRSWSWHSIIRQSLLLKRPSQNRLARLPPFLIINSIIGTRTW
jgi:hypothetical protein